MPQVSPLLRDLGVSLPRLPHPCRVLCDRVGTLTLGSGIDREGQNPHPVPAKNAGTRVGQPSVYSGMKSWADPPAFETMLQRVRIADLLAQLRARNNGADLWWGFVGEPTHAEIRAAIEAKDFEEQRNDGDMYPGDRRRHVARIAHLVANPRNSYPPERDHPVRIVNNVLDNGVHRVLAHHYLGNLEISAEVETTTDSR